MTDGERARLQEIEKAWLNLLVAEVNAYKGVPDFAARFGKERNALSEAIAACLAAEDVAVEQDPALQHITQVLGPAPLRAANVLAEESAAYEHEFYGDDQ